MKEVKNVELHVTVARWMLEELAEDYKLDLDTVPDQVIDDFARDCARSLILSGFNNEECALVINRQ